MSLRTKLVAGAIAAVMGLELLVAGCASQPAQSSMPQVIAIPARPPKTSAPYPEDIGFVEMTSLIRDSTHPINEGILIGAVYELPENVRAALGQNEYGTVSQQYLSSLENNPEAWLALPDGYKISYVGGKRGGKYTVVDQELTATSIELSTNEHKDFGTFEVIHRGASRYVIDPHFEATLIVELNQGVYIPPSPNQDIMTWLGLVIAC